MAPSGLNQNSPITASVTATGNLSFQTAGVQILDVNNDGKLDIAVDMNSEIYVALGTVTANSARRSRRRSQVVMISIRRFERRWFS